MNQLEVAKHPGEHREREERAHSGWAWFAGQGVWWVLACIPFGILLFALFGHSVDVLVKDEWTLVLPVAKSYEGTLTFADFWFRQNEHRMVFPLLFWIPFIRLTRWAKPWPVVPDVLLAAAWFLLLALHLRATARRLAAQHGAWYLPLFSLIVFSLLPREIWVENVGVAVRLAAILATAAFFALTAEPLTWPKVWAAITAAGVASFSFGNGLLIWPVGCVPLACARVGARRKAAYVALWVAAAGLTYASFVVDFRANPEHPAWAFAARHPFAFLKYLFAYLGGPASRLHPELTGLAGTAVFAGAALWLSASGAGRLRAALPYLVLGLFGITSALWTAVGRAGFGVGQALSPRYAVHASFLWLGAAGVLFLLLETDPPGGDPFESARAWVALVAAYVITVCIALTSLEAFHYYHEFIPLLERARAELLSQRGEFDEAILQTLHPTPGYVRERIPVLKKYGLSVFRDSGAA